MSFIVDNNLSYKVSLFLQKSFSTTTHVVNLELDKNTSDKKIWEYALSKNLTILTKDNDFEILSRYYGCPPKVIQLLCGNKSTIEIINILSDKINDINNFLNDNENCLLNIF